MTQIGQKERVTQDRVVQVFKEQLGYRYLGNWEYRENNRNIEESILREWLGKQGVSDALIGRTLHQLQRASALGQGSNLYEPNKEVYRLLRYGVKEKEGAGELNKTVWLIDWKNPENNDFAIAEEVTIRSANTKRPDVVLYVNGIALGVLELKRSSVSVGEGIRQNLDNQKKDFIRNFFTTIQLVMAGNDSQGLRYGTIETTEKYFLEWKEEGEAKSENGANRLDEDLAHLCSKKRLLQIIHDFIVFDSGVKKTCRHNQFFGIEAAKNRIKQREGGIIWHTQGSGKSLTMVWLAKWIRENIQNSRVLIITDRTELDEQIEKVFNGVDESIERTKSGADLIDKLNHPNPWLLCSLVHKFGRQAEANDEDDDAHTEEFIAELDASLPRDFAPKGELFVFVDECHRTQSGKLHKAMKYLLPEALFIGFTGTPLLSKDKKKSIEVFGSYIHTYKFNEAVSDGVVLDLRYEARDIDQRITSQKHIDAWFEGKTKNLSNLGKTQLKQKWGTLQKVLSSKSRLEQIVSDILLDMDIKPRLAVGRGNAMLVCDSVYQACKAYEMFSRTDLKGKVAIVTSYQPNVASIKGEESGTGESENLFKYQVYRQMLAEFFDESEDDAAKKVELFEKKVKERFIKEPGQMRLLIVVDKLLTGFDAPSATYLYIDKKMADHNLFQAICRVNRLDGEDKTYGYIIDYKDLFKSLDKAIADYTKEAFANYDKEDVESLLKNRLEQAKEDLDDALETVRALCEPVKAPREPNDYYHYFCGISGENDKELLEKEGLRLKFYQSVSALMRAYMDIANELTEAGYSQQEIQRIETDIVFYPKLRDELKSHSGDFVDLKSLEPAMRHLIDMYIQADPSEELMNFEELGLLEVIMQKSADAANNPTADEPASTPENMAEAIENNLRRTLVEKNPINPKYYEKMSLLLDELVKERRKQALSYKEYLESIKELTRKTLQPTYSDYPSSVRTQGQQAIYDNLGKNEELTKLIHDTVMTERNSGWLGNRMKERALANAIHEAAGSYGIDVAVVMEIIKAQSEYVYD